MPAEEDAEMELNSLDDAKREGNEPLYGTPRNVPPADPRPRRSSPWTREAINRLSAEEYSKHLNDPEFVQAVEELFPRR